MPRLMLSDEHWFKLLASMKAVGVYSKSRLRRTVEGILYKLRVGCSWRDLPQYFGKWNSIFKRFNDWSRLGKLNDIFQKLASEPDHEWHFVDGSIVKAHQHSSGAAFGEETAIGKSVAGNSTKIHLAVDAYGLPIAFTLTGGEVHDCKEAPKLVANLPSSDYVIADKGYDSDQLRIQITKRGATPVIPRKKNSKIGNDDIDWCLYKYRHLVENAFARLKHFRSIATRFEKLKRNYAGILALACAYIWLPL